MLSTRPYIPNITGLGTAFLRGSWLREVAKLLYKGALYSAQKVFFQNSADLDLFVNARLVNPAKAILVPGSGVDLSRYQLSPYPANERIVFLFIGRLLKDKGLNEFIEAARRIKVGRHDVRFQLLGPADAINRTAIGRERVDQWVAEGVVEYLGETDDVRPFIANADCVVLPSYREGKPRALLEAAAMGRPIITTDAIGCRDVVEHTVTGLMCRAQDVDALAISMRDMASHSRADREQMGRAGRSKVEREYDESIVIERYISELRSLIPGV